MKLSFFAIKKCNEYRNVSMSKENLIIALDKLAKAENESQGSQMNSCGSKKINGIKSIIEFIRCSVI